MSSDYFYINVSVDALEWTRHWLGTRRCDLLQFGIATRPDVIPGFRIVAIESKSRLGGAPVNVTATAEPFKEGLTQVVDTLDALVAVLEPDAGASLQADLKLTSLFEHLTSEVLSQLHPIEANEGHKIEILRRLSLLSKRELNVQQDVRLSGMVVVTQRDTVLPTSSVGVRAHGVRDWDVVLVRCGTPALREMFEDALLSELAVGGLAYEPITPVVATLAAEPAIVGAAHPMEPMNEEISEMIAQLESACRLRGFQIEAIDTGQVVEGPTLVVVPVELAAGASIRPIETAGEDISRELGVAAVTVENDPIRPYHIRFLLPRKARTFPPLPPDPPQEVDPGTSHYLGINLGMQVDGGVFRTFVSEWPHLLVAGTTGSGKTTLLKSLLIQLDRVHPGEVNLVVVDGKGEYDYVRTVRREHFPDRFPEVQLGHQYAVDVLRWLVEEEIERRRRELRRFVETKRDAPPSPRHAYVKARVANQDFPIRPLVIVIDEFAEIMLGAGATARAFEDLVQRAVQMGRSALVHLVLATQRPDANVLRGAIKANLPARVVLALPTHHDSMTVLGSKGAEQLLGMGDMLFQTSTSQRVRLQGFTPDLT